MKSTAASLLIDAVFDDNTCCRLQELKSTAASLLMDAVFDDNTRCRLQELKSTAASLLMDAVFDDPWTNALTQCLAARDFVRVCTQCTCFSLSHILDDNDADD